MRIAGLVRRDQIGPGKRLRLGFGIEWVGMKVHHIGLAEPCGLSDLRQKWLVLTVGQNLRKIGARSRLGQIGNLVAQRSEFGTEIPDHPLGTAVCKNQYPIVAGD